MPLIQTPSTVEAVANSWYMVAGPFGRKRSLKQKLDWKTKSSNVAR